ncbi:uncharacterized protein VTP21DRAFT_7655 [Calcarisporiella thermophila]|uniref:uncharacterized protein n=1 Tax=Calcarisporiella thermophila TaxID=911321 RepID=UPI003741EBA7
MRAFILATFLMLGVAIAAPSGQPGSNDRKLNVTVYVLSAEMMDASSIAHFSTVGMLVAA